jgi:type I restriction enzyme R subunit
MKQIAEYVINEGAITSLELNTADADLWRKGVQSFTPQILDSEIQTMARFLLRTA